jgi:rubrerythrin
MANPDNVAEGFPFSGQTKIIIFYFIKNILQRHAPSFAAGCRMKNLYVPTVPIDCRMATIENAKEALAGESQANRKYQAFSDKAAEEGFKNVATLYKAASEAEAIHAKKLLKVLSAIESTEKNLEASIAGETHEFTTMYPEFVKAAEAEKRSDAVLAFTHAMKAEEVHAGLYRKALAAVKSKQDLGREKVFLCPVCGNIEMGKAPEKCPICGVFGKQFREITL